MVNQSPYVSIVVPVLNRDRSIGRCVQSLLELDYPSFEVIVVDNGSTDQTCDIVSKFPVKLVTENRRGAYAARNRGLAVSKGELIFFVDSDCIAHREVLKNLVRNLRTDNTVGVGGQLQTYEPATLTEQFEDLAGILVFDLPKGQIRWEKERFLSGAIYTSNALFTREILMKMNGFDADFRSGGDFNLCWQIQRAGYRITFDPEAVVQHIHRSDIRGLIKQFFKYGAEQPRLLKKQPDPFSYFKLKTYLLRPYEFRLKLPIRMLVTLDCCNLFLLGLILASFSPWFVYVSCGLFSLLLLGTFRESLNAVRRSGQAKWLLLYPFFHLVRHYSFTAGRIWGGLRQRVFAI